MTRKYLYSTNFMQDYFIFIQYVYESEMFEKVNLGLLIKRESRV